MRKRLLTLAASAALVIVVTAALSAAALAAPELPYDTAAECLECHGVGVDPAFAEVDFAVPAVDYVRCRACHYKTSHYEQNEGQCNECHLIWPDRDVYYDGSYWTEYGYFDTRFSLDADAQTLHDVHVNGSWLQGVLGLADCDDCHMPAACTACHDGGALHGEHTFDEAAQSYGSEPVTYWQSTGSKRFEGAVTCVSAGCHELDAAALPGFAAPPCLGCHTSGHQDQPVLHDSGATSCDGSSCHVSADVAATHGATEEAPFDGCGLCHEPSASPDSSDCNVCHPAAVDEHHAAHDAGGLSPGCSNCHDSYLDDEHEAQGLSCATCHESSDPVVVAAMEAGIRDCDTCHPDRHYRRKGR